MTVSGLYWVLDCLLRFIVGGCVFALIGIATIMTWSVLMVVVLGKEPPDSSLPIIRHSAQVFDTEEAMLKAVAAEGMLATVSGQYTIFVYQNGQWRNVE